MAKYVYPAILTPEEDGRFSVVFPDLESCYTCGDDLHDALEMAEDVLAFSLFELENGHMPIPKASENLDLTTYPTGSFVNLVACDTLEYQKMNNNKAVKKTLSVPEWLNEKAMAAGLNFSQVLQEALKNKLGVY